MTYLNKIYPLIEPAPQSNIVTDSGNLHPDWKNWFDSLHRYTFNKASLQNDSVVTNPDFHWGVQTPVTGDGEVCDSWLVKANGLTHTTSRQPYTSTAQAADTGSKQYINAAITGGSGQNYELYQEIPNKMSKYQNKTLTISSKISNNGADDVLVHYYVGIDTNSDGTDDHHVTSSQYNLRPGLNNVSGTVQVPAVDTDNQNNKVTVKKVFNNILGNADLDMHYVKDEFAVEPTVLHVDHPLEKYKIDNP